MKEGKCAREAAYTITNRMGLRWESMMRVCATLAKCFRLALACAVYGGLFLAVFLMSVMRS